MADIIAARKTAYSTLKQHRLTKPSLDDLLLVTKGQGYSIIDFSISDTDSSTKELLQELDLESFAHTCNSFVFKSGDIKLVFLRETMNAGEKLYALAHELGHILCGHLEKRTTCSIADLDEEHEANEFAHYLLHPGPDTKARIIICSHKILAIVALVILLLGIVSIPVIKQLQISRSYYGEYYVTESGEKYHSSDCPIIKDRTNIHRLTIEEYESGKYEPCQICLSEENSN